MSKTASKNSYVQVRQTNKKKKQKVTSNSNYLINANLTLPNINLLLIFNLNVKKPKIYLITLSPKWNYPLNMSDSIMQIEGKTK